MTLFLSPTMKLTATETTTVVLDYGKFERLEIIVCKTHLLQQDPQTTGSHS